MSEISKLNYAPRPPIHRRRVFRRSILSFFLLAIVVFGWWGARPVWRRIQLLYWQHRCIVYIPRSGQVIYDSESPISVVPKEWREFYSRLSPPGFNSYGTPFMGELTRPNGDRRLVVVDVLESKSVAGGITAWPRVFLESGPLRPAIELSGKNNSSCELGVALYLDHPRLDGSGDDPMQFDTLKVFSGIRDASDRTHFSFRALRNGTRHKYEGWLCPDDSVIIGEQQGQTFGK